MIKLIGFKRMIFLACLLALNLSVLGIYFSSIGPMLDDVTSQRDSVRGQTAALREKINSIKKDMAFVNDNMSKYNDLKDKGFFLNQDRFMINRTMEDLRVKAGIPSFSFTIADIKDIPNVDAEAVNYRLIDSHIKVDTVVSPLDSNIYMLAQEIAHSFPSAVRLQDMNLTRASEVTEATLNDIAAGKLVNFVNATIEFDWITMVPKTADAATPAGAPVGFRSQ